jgi:hypothetical protein
MTFRRGQSVGDGMYMSSPLFLCIWPGHQDETGGSAAICFSTLATACVGGEGDTKSEPVRRCVRADGQQVGGGVSDKMTHEVGGLAKAGRRYMYMYMEGWRYWPELEEAPHITPGQTRKLHKRLDVESATICPAVGMGLRGGCSWRPLYGLVNWLGLHVAWGTQKIRERKAWPK